MFEGTRQPSSVTLNSNGDADRITMVEGSKGSSEKERRAEDVDLELAPSKERRGPEERDGVDGAHGNGVERMHTREHIWDAEEAVPNELPTEGEIHASPSEVFDRTEDLAGHPKHYTEVRQPDGSIVTFPDGGRGWLVVAGGCHVLFATFGFVNAWGCFQKYYEDQWPDKTTSQIAWIGSLQYLLVYLPALPMGRLVDESKHYYPFYAATILYPASCFLTAEVKEYWQAVLSHGVLFGFMAGVLFCPGITVVQQWFYRRRAYALGFVAASASVGGTVFPIIVTQCLKRVGFSWTMRICGFILLYCFIFASITLRTRLPPKKAPGSMFNLKAFRQTSYSLLTLGSFFIMGGLYTPLSFLGVMGTGLGLGTYSTYLISIANACSFVGRLGPSYFADKTGSLNLLIPALLGSAATTFGWPFATSKASLTVIAGLNGVFLGAYVALLAPSVASLGGVDDLGRRFGMVNSIMAFGSLIGNPVDGAIIAAQGGSFHGVSLYAGFIIVIGVSLFFSARFVHLGSLFGRL